MSSKISRREFLRTAGVGTVAVGLGVRSEGGLSFGQTPGGIQRRPLGSTGLKVSILGLGCATIGQRRWSQREGARVVSACVDAGINYVDCASTYGDAEKKVGLVMRDRRKEVILATKTLERDRESSWREINRSLELLRTSYVDLLQIHAVNRMEDLDRVTARDGALGAVLRAREEGMCRHIGITGHARPDVIAEALERFPFDTILVPLSSTDRLLRDFGEVVFPLSAQRRFGVIAMKTLAAGRVTSHVPESLRYAFSLPVSAAVVGMGSEAEVERNVAAARSFLPMSEEEKSTLEEKTRAYATGSIMWWKRD
jgi:aryl-alcohol dehydrogenase-like predicted oxidoreductase